MNRYVPLYIAGFSGVFMAFHVWWLAVPLALAAVFCQSLAMERE